MTSGRAEVVKSRSFWSRPIIASRTGPPTSASSSPASANTGAELVDDRADAVQLRADAALDLDDRERGQGGVGHDRPLYVPVRVVPNN